MDRQDTDALNETNLETVRIKPKWIAQRCPVCNGWKTVGNMRKPCEVCGALGFIKIPVEEVSL